jgi:hypothetical protein
MDSPCFEINPPGRCENRLFIHVTVVFLLRGETAQGVHLPINIACEHSLVECIAITKEEAHEI